MATARGSDEPGGLVGGIAESATTPFGAVLGHQKDGTKPRRMWPRNFGMAFNPGGLIASHAVLSLMDHADSSALGRSLKLHDTYSPGAYGVLLAERQGQERRFCRQSADDVSPAGSGHRQP